MSSYQAECKISLQAHDVFMEQTLRICWICLQPLPVWHRYSGNAELQERSVTPTSPQRSEGTGWYPLTYSDRRGE